MKKIILIFGFTTVCLASFSQETGTFKDPRDAKVYKTVKIGNQWIMAENLPINLVVEIIGLTIMTKKM